MEIKAIVYISKTGFTKQYADILKEKTSLPIYSISEAKKALHKNTPIIYLAPLFANNIKNYKKVNKRYDIKAVCGVGLCDTGALVDVVRKNSKIDSSIPVFTLQGGIDKTKLKGIDLLLINVLLKSLNSKQNKDEQEERMHYLLSNDASYVSEDNCKDFLSWYSSNK